MSLMDIYRSIVITVGTLWSAIWGAVVVIVDFILNVNIGFLVSIAAVLACAWLFVCGYDRLMSGLKNKYNIVPYSKTDSTLIFINIMVYLVLVFTVGYFIEYISKAFKVI